MADPRYSVDWAPPDIGPGASFIASILNQNRQNDRADEYARMQRDAMAASEKRVSHEAKRQEEMDKYKRSLDAWNAMPMLQRAATRSIGMANANPYGVKFEQEQGPAPSIADVDIMGAKGGQYAQHAAQALMGGPAPQATLEPGAEGPEMDPAAEAARFPVAGNALEAPSAPSGIDAAQAVMAQPRSQRMFANFQGQRFEVPEQSDKTPFGPEYDAIFNGLIDQGESPHNALKVVSAQYKADKSQDAIADRVSGQIQSRETLARELRPDVATQEDWLMRRLNQSDINSRRGAAARVASAGSEFKQEGVNDRLYGLLDRRVKQVKDTAQYSKLAAENKTVRSIMANIATGSVPLQHADAQISLARFFRQAQPTEGEMHMLYSNLGGTADKWNQFVARISKGDLSAEQMRQLKAAAQSVHHEHKENLKRFQQVAQKGLGPKSGMDLIPDQAQQAYEMLGAELGMEDLPPLYQTEGGITLGSGKAPDVKPRGAKKTELDSLEEWSRSLRGKK